MTRSALIAGLVLTALMAGGCNRPAASSWTASSILTVIHPDEFLINAGSQGVAISTSGGGHTRDDCSLLIDRKMHATIRSGNVKSLLAAYRTAIKREIETAGGSIFGSGLAGQNENEVRDFSFSYTWNGNRGTIHVWSVEISETEAEVILFGYEHRTP